MHILEERGYQIKSVAPAVAALQTTLKALIVMATGLGKTVVCGMAINEYFKHKSSFRILYLCDKSIGLSQSEQEFLGKMQMQIEAARMYGDHHAKVSRRGKTITFASFQKLNSAREWYKQFSQNHFDLIVVDEAHYAFAPTYYEVIKYFANNGKTPLLGMTATPYRSDQKDIRQLFGEPVVNIPLEDGIAMGALADFTYSINADDLDESKLDSIIKRELKGQRRRPTIKSLNTTLFIKKRDQEIVKQIKYETRNGEKTLIFCKSIAQANRFAELLGPKAKPYHSKIDKKANAAVLKDFKTGNTKYLLTVDKLNEAFDMPEVEVIVFLRSTSSRRIFMQQLGRGLRKNREKKVVKILDFAGNCERLVMLATLVDNMKKAQERFGAAMDSPTVLKKRRATSTIQRVYDLKGEHCNFVFTHKVVKMLELLRVIRDGFYKTWQEASLAAISLGFKTGEAYKLGYRSDLRLHSNPEKFYRDFPGWDKFLEKKLAPEGWLSSSGITEKHRPRTSITNISLFAETHRGQHPEWFMWCDNNGLVPKVQYYHPNLVEIILNFFSGRTDAPPGWMTPDHVARLPHVLGGKSKVEMVAETFREKHPEWFKPYMATKHFSEHYHPRLVKMIENSCSRGEAPEDWVTANKIALRFGCNRLLVMKLAETHREKHPEWFGVYTVRGRWSAEHYHSQLANLIGVELLRRNQNTKKHNAKK